MTLALLLIASAHALDTDSFAKLIPNAFKSAPDNFATTYSPCLDGAVVNFRAAGCRVIAQDPEVLGPGSVGMVCVAPTVKNGYSLNEHVFFATINHDVTDFKGWNVFCVDPNVTMYIPDHPKP